MLGDIFALRKIRAASLRVYACLRLSPIHWSGLPAWPAELCHRDGRLTAAATSPLAHPEKLLDLSEGGKPLSPGLGPPYPAASDNILAVGHTLVPESKPLRTTGGNVLLVSKQPSIRVPLQLGFRLLSMSPAPRAAATYRIASCPVIEGCPCGPPARTISKYRARVQALDLLPARQDELATPPARLKLFGNHDKIVEFGAVPSKGDFQSSNRN